MSSGAGHRMSGDGVTYLTEGERQVVTRMINEKGDDASLEEKALWGKLNPMQLED